MADIQLQSDVFFPTSLIDSLREVINKYAVDKVFFITEENTERLCWPILNQNGTLTHFPRLTIGVGEEAKNSDTLVKVWHFLSNNGADRKSLVISLGGGMLTDLCGFAASTFKRGMHFINIPTTLLSQVDASVGGKTGINLNGFKNEVGTFALPKAVFIDTVFLNTIDDKNFRSGYAEMVKHGLIFSKQHLEQLKAYDLDSKNLGDLKQLIHTSVGIKDYFVTNDPTEKGIRKALNFGHTAGHAFESLAMSEERVIPHGHAVAYGMIVELYLSYKKLGFDYNELIDLTQWLVNIYGKLQIEEKHFDLLYRLMTHDKKNEQNRINFTLIPSIGKFEIDIDCKADEIIEGLNFYSNF